MAERDSLAELAGDLLALAPRDRRAVLADLTRAERASIQAILDQESARRDSVDAVPGAFRSFSPWLAARLRQVSQGEQDSRPVAGLTDSTRAAILRLAEKVGERAELATLELVNVQPKSLFGAVAGFFATGRLGQ